MSGKGSDPAVVVDHVSKRFRIYENRNQSIKGTVLGRGRSTHRDFWAVKDVSLEIPVGTTFGLIGENGSGKSTLLKCIANILRADEGRITVNGSMSALLEVGAGFHPELSGRENVFMNGAILGMPRKELTKRFDDIVDFAGLAEFIDQPVKNYSSGMYVKLGFSIAISVDPDVLLVDEILAVGDESFQRRCAERFADLRNAGKTIVVVSHALGQVRSLCDEVAWLEHGKLLDIGRPGPIIDTYVEGVRLETGTADASGGTRAGSGEASIWKAELLDGEGQTTKRVRTGEAVTFRLHYRCTKPVERPIVGIGLTTLEGTSISGPNTRDGGAQIDVLDGEGHIDLAIPRLMLLPGEYEIATAIMDQALMHEYEGWSHALRFDVLAGHPREQSGALVHLDGTWSRHPG